MGVRISRLILTFALATGAGGVIKSGCENLLNRRPTATIIHPIPGSKFKLGAFANDASDGRHLACLESHIGKRFDLSVRYLRVDKELFPTAEAELMRDRNVTLFLKIKITPSQLDKLGNPRYSARLTALNDGLKEFGGRIFVGFDLSEVLGYDNLASVFNLFFQKLTAGNVTWVWNQAFGEIPPGKKIEWTSIEVFQRPGDPSLQEMLKPKLDEAKKNNLAVLLTVGSSAPEDIQAKFVEDAVRIASENDAIDYLILHNVPTTTKGKFENWHLTPKALAALKASLSSELQHTLSSKERFESYFIPDTNIKIYQKCEEIEESHYKVDDIQKLSFYLTEIQKINKLLERSIGSSQETPLRQALASLYVDMAYLFKNDENKRLDLLMHAVAILQEPFKRDQERIEKGVKPARFPTIKGYFDMIIQIASSIDRAGNSKEAERIYREALENLKDDKKIVEEQVSSYARAGYQSRIYVQLGLIYERRGELEEAENFYKKADSWATNEQDRSWLSLFWRGEDRTKLRHTATLARLGQARINLARFKPNEALKILGLLFNWPEVGSEDGFMDLGFEALIYGMEASLTGSRNLQEAKEKFREAYDWKKINKYQDLKRALQCEDVDLSQVDPWEIILHGLENVDLRQDLQSRLNSIKLLTVETQSKN